VPGAGEGFDLLSAIISARRGEWLDVRISVLSGALLFGMALGAGKIFARLKRLGAIISKLKGPAREILANLIEALTKELKNIPIDSVRGAFDGVKRFIKRLRELLDEAVGKLRKSRIRRRVLTPDEQKLLKELEQNGVKHSPDRIVRIGKSRDGKIVFLEAGDAESGLTHILEEHGGQFAGRGIPADSVADVVFDAATKGKLVSSTRSGANVRNVYEIVYHGRRHRIAVGIGSNGYIVTAYPK